MAIGNNFIVNGILQIKDAIIKNNVFKKISQATAGTGPGLAKGFGQASAQVNVFGKSLGQANNNMNLLDHSADLFLRRMAQFAILLPTFSALNSAIQGGAKFMVDFQTELSKVIRTDPKNLTKEVGNITDKVFELGKEFGVTADVIVGTLRVFKQAGFDLEKSFDLAKAAALATTVTTLDLEAAQEILIQSMNIFKSEGLAATDVVDKLANVEDRAAVDAIDLAEAFRTGGNALEFATKSFDDTIGLISGLREQSRKSGREIGTFFKTLSTRVFAEGDAKSALEAFGIQVENMDGSLRPLLDVLNELKVTFDGLTEAQQATAAKSIAGVRQFESLLATLNSLDTANQISRDSANSNGVALKKLELQAKNVSFQFGQFLSKLQELSVSLGESGLYDFFSKTLGVAGDLADLIGSLVRTLKNGGLDITPLLGVGAVSLAKKTFGKPAQKAPKSSNLVSTTPVKNTQRRGVTTVSPATLGVFQPATPPSKTPKQGKKNVTPNNFVSSGKLVNSTTALAVKFASLVVASQAVTVATTILQQSLIRSGNATAKFAAGMVDAAGNAASTAIQFSTLGGKAALLAGGLSLALSAATGLSKIVKDELSGQSELKSADRKDAQFESLVKQASDTSTSTFKVLLEAFKKQSNAPQFNTKSLFKDIKEEVTATSPDLGEFLKSDDISRVISKEFLSGFGKALNINDIDQKLSESISSGLQAVLANLKSDRVMDRFAEAIDPTQALINISLMTEESLTLAQSLNEAELKFISINQALKDFTTISPEDFIQSDDFKKAKSERELALSAEAAAITNLNNLVAILNKDLQGFESSKDLSLLISRLKELSLSADATQIGILNQLRSEFPSAASVAESGIDKLVQAQIELRESNLRVAETTNAITGIEVKQQFARNKAAREFTDSIKEQTIEFEKQFRDLGISVDSDSLSALTDIKLDDVFSGKFELSDEIKSLVESLSGSQLQNAQQEFINGIDSSAAKLSLLKDRLKSVEDSLSRLSESGKVVDIALGLTKDELMSMEDALKLDIRASEFEAAKTNIENLINIEKFRAEALAKSAKEARQFSAALHEVTVSFEQFVNNKRNTLLNEEADAQLNLKNAQGGTIEATRSLSEAYKEFRASLININDAVVGNAIEFNLLNRDIGILTGKISNFSGRLNSLNQAYVSVLSKANISLQKRIELERQLANETLSFLQEARSEIVNSGLGVFGQSAEENRSLQEGIGGLELVAQKLGGSFDAFLEKSKSGFNSLSNELLNLPLDLRKKILDALSALPSSADIGGFSVEQLREAIGQVGAGVDPSVGLPSLGEITDLQVQQLERLQELAIKDSELQANQLFSSQEQLLIAQEQLDVAKLLQERAESDLLSVRESVDYQSGLIDSAVRLQEKLTRDVITASNTNKLDQIREQANEFQKTRDLFGDVGAEIVQSISKLAEARRGSLEADSSISSNYKGFIPNYSSGNLTPKEASGLINAGIREKRMMPAGARLAVANTHEAIIPLNKGYIPNFAEGTPISAGIAAGRSLNDSVVAAISASLTKSLQGLPGDNEQVNSMLRILSDIKSETVSVRDNIVALQTIVGSDTSSDTASQSSNISVNLDSNQNTSIVVTGLEALQATIENAIRSAVDKQVAEKLVPVREAISSIFSSLRERGLVSSMGHSQ